MQKQSNPTPNAAQAALHTAMPAPVPPDLDGWMGLLCDTTFPVLPDTIASLARLEGDQATIGAQDIANVVQGDPLMCVQLYRHVAALRAEAPGEDVRTVTACLVMTGITPFFRKFASLAPVTAPPGCTQLLRQGLNFALWRAQRAASYAFDWAIRRGDYDAELIATSALLHDFVDLLLWCHWPRLAARLRASQDRDPGAPGEVAERALLNVSVAELRQALAARWHLPVLLRDDAPGITTNDPRRHNVTLAVALARHSMNGWHDPALHEDCAALGALLNMSPVQARLLATDEGFQA